MKLTSRVASVPTAALPTSKDITSSGSLSKNQTGVSNEVTRSANQRNQKNTGTKELHFRVTQTFNVDLSAFFGHEVLTRASNVKDQQVFDNSERAQTHSYREEGLSAGAIVTEDLPHPIVYYPNKYGSFLAFSKDSKCRITICSCAENAILNYMKLRSLVLRGTIDLPRHVYHPFSKLQESNQLTDAEFFPSVIADQIRTSAPPQEAFLFSPNLCHKCNSKVPSLPYCHRDYSSGFVSKFGWYVNQAYLRYGIFPHELGRSPARFTFFSYLSPEGSLPELQELESKQRKAQELFIAESKRLTGLMEVIESHNRPTTDVNLDEYYRLHSEVDQDAGALNRAVENLVREEFGKRKIGDAWVIETRVYEIVQRIFPGESVLRHDRPVWLEGLELDIYLPTLRLAIEYQGQQHFYPIKAWGGQLALDKLRERDAHKARLCKKNGVTLIYFAYTQPLNEDHVREVLSRFVKPV